MDEITVALDGAGDLLAEVRGAVKRVLDGLHGKVSVTPINDFENIKKSENPPFRDIYRGRHSLKGLDYNLSMLCAHDAPFTPTTI